VSCQKRGPEGGAVEVVEARFDVEEEGGNLEFRPLEGPDLLCLGEAGVQGAKAREGAALVTVEHVPGAVDGRELDRHDSFENPQQSLEKDYYAEGCWGVVRRLSCFVKDTAVRIFQ